MQTADRLRFVFHTYNIDDYDRMEEILNYAAIKEVVVKQEPAGE